VGIDRSDDAVHSDDSSDRLSAPPNDDQQPAVRHEISELDA
jgi:hypothetical protein